MTTAESGCPFLPAAALPAAGRVARRACGGMMHW